MLGRQALQFHVIFFNETEFSVDFDVESTLPLSLRQCNRRKHLKNVKKQGTFRTIKPPPKNRGDQGFLFVFFIFNYLHVFLRTRSGGSSEYIVPCFVHSLSY